MKLKVDDLEFNLLVGNLPYNKNKIPIIFLHGFTGNSNDWIFIFDKLPSHFFPVAIDLIGHGESSSPEDQTQYSCGNIIHHLNSIIDQLGFEKLILVGYSMGGRAALSYSIKYPHKIIGAVFESTTAGIEDISEKKSRVEHDFLLSDNIRKNGIEWFIDFWLNLPMFGSIKEVYDINLLKSKRTQNNVVGISNLLAGFSTGLMSCYWDELYYLEFPVLLICGSLDEKYTLISSRMSERIQNVSLKIIEDAGHNTHLEKPELFTKLLFDFINSLKGKNEI